MRSARFKGVRVCKMGRVGKTVVRQGKEAHNRVNTCLNYRDPRGRHHQQFRMPEKRADSRKNQSALQNSRL